MAESYLEDGRHFREDDDPVNALASFSYGHAWLDAGARIGLFDVPREGTPVHGLTASTAFRAVCNALTKGRARAPEQWRPCSGTC